MVVISWLFERAAHWVLDRNAIHGHVGTTLLVNEDEDDEDDEDEADDGGKASRHRFPRHSRSKIYCLDLKISNKPDEFIEEVKRIHKENAVQVVGLGDFLNATPVKPSTNGSNGNGCGRAMENPTNDTALSIDGMGLSTSDRQSD